jgi:hypothetical protein
MITANATCLILDDELAISTLTRWRTIDFWQPSPAAEGLGGLFWQTH